MQSQTNTRSYLPASRNCAYQDCSRPVGRKGAKGFCSKHYKQLTRRMPVGDLYLHGDQPVREAGRFTKEYKAWSSMKSRCYYPNNASYARYGGRGIEVCERWRNSYPNFLADVGIAPGPDYSLDRWPDSDGNYEPGNCRWATPVEQSANRSSTGLLRNAKGQYYRA